MESFGLQPNFNKIKAYSVHDDGAFDMVHVPLFLFYIKFMLFLYF